MSNRTERGQRSSQSHAPARKSTLGWRRGVLALGWPEPLLRRVYSRLCPALSCVKVHF